MRARSFAGGTIVATSAAPIQRLQSGSARAPVGGPPSFGPQQSGSFSGAPPHFLASLAGQGGGAPGVIAQGASFSGNVSNLCPPGGMQDISAAAPPPRAVERLRSNPRAVNPGGGFFPNAPPIAPNSILMSTSGNSTSSCIPTASPASSLIPRQGSLIPTASSTSSLISSRTLAAFSGPLPVPAYKYRADTSDMVDMAMSWTLCKLDATSSASLWLRRVTVGRYEIDGRRVSVRWLNQKRTNLVASEDDVHNAECVPLLDYLRQASSVAKSLETLQMSGTALSPMRSPSAEGDELFHGFSDVDSERIRSMLVACRAAGAKDKEREKAVRVLNTSPKKQLFYSPGKMSL